MSDTCIGDFTSVSIGASFKPGVTIGRNCFVSIGAVVTKNIEDNTNAIGNPARGLSQSK
jgi:acetyltransferase-like isoleucine patch superfamily enzyme